MVMMVFPFNEKQGHGFILYFIAHYIIVIVGEIFLPVEFFVLFDIASGRRNYCSILFVMCTNLDSVLQILFCINI